MKSVGNIGIGTRLFVTIAVTIVLMFFGWQLFLAESNKPSKKEVLDYFGRIAFGSESGEAWDHIQKFNLPVRVRVEGRPKENDVKKVRHTVEELRAITGHDIQMFDPDNYKIKSNFVVTFVERKYFSDVLALYDSKIYKNRPEKHRSNVRNTIMCMGRPYPGFNSTIGFVLILIPTDVIFRDRAACIVEELSQSLGLPNDSKEAKFSIFNDYSSYNELTAHDRALLKLLYRPEVKPGLSKKEAIAVVETLLETVPEILQGY